jgi:hypothetical protein
MKDNEMEQLLEKICREQVEPPQNLVNYTKQRIKRSPFLNLVIFLSLLLNAMITVSVTVVFFLPGLEWLEKILWYLGNTALFNGLIVLILLNRDRVNGFFRQFTAAVNHQH